MADRPDDPFAPPGAGAGDDGSLQLGREVRRAPSPVAGDPGEPPLSAPARQAVAYKKPPGGIGNFVIWGLATLGLGAAVLFGASVLKRGAEGNRPAPSTGPATVQAARNPAAAPERPVTWKPVETGARVLVTVEVSPRGARLLLDGAPLPSNPVHLDRGSTHTIAASAPGFESSSTELTAAEATTVRLKLKRAR